jgi:hypothetical protein
VDAFGDHFVHFVQPISARCLPRNMRWQASWFSQGELQAATLRWLCNCKLRGQAWPTDVAWLVLVWLAFFLQKFAEMRTTWITVALFDDVQAARTLETFLKDNKIDARTFDDKSLQIFLFLCRPQATFGVQVRHPFHKLALDILNTNPPAALLKAIHCPECGSLRISYPQMARKFVWPTLFLHWGIIFRFIGHQAHCETCHYVWILPKSEGAGRHEPVPHAGAGGKP